MKAVIPDSPDCTAWWTSGGEVEARQLAAGGGEVERLAVRGRGDAVLAEAVDGAADRVVGLALVGLAQGREVEAGRRFLRRLLLGPLWFGRLLLLGLLLALGGGDVGLRHEAGRGEFGLEVEHGRDRVARSRRGSHGVRERDVVDEGAQEALVEGGEAVEAQADAGGAALGVGADPHDLGVEDEGVALMTAQQGEPQVGPDRQGARGADECAAAREVHQLAVEGRSVGGAELGVEGHRGPGLGPAFGSTVSVAGHEGWSRAGLEEVSRRLVHADHNTR
jgi:hypothetical protein